MTKNEDSKPNTSQPLESGQEWLDACRALDWLEEALQQVDADGNFIITKTELAELPVSEDNAQWHKWTQDNFLKLAKTNPSEDEQNMLSLASIVVSAKNTSNTSKEYDALVFLKQLGLRNPSAITRNDVRKERDRLKAENALIHEDIQAADATSTNFQRLVEIYSGDADRYSGVSVPELKDVVLTENSDEAKESLNFLRQFSKIIDGNGDQIVTRTELESYKKYLEKRFGGEVATSLLPYGRYLNFLLANFEEIRTKAPANKDIGISLDDIRQSQASDLDSELKAAISFLTRYHKIELDVDGDRYITKDELESYRTKLLDTAAASDDEVAKLEFLFDNFAELQTNYPADAATGISPQDISAARLAATEELIVSIVQSKSFASTFSAREKEALSSVLSNVQLALTEKRVNKRLDGSIRIKFVVDGSEKKKQRAQLLLLDDGGVELDHIKFESSGSKSLTSI